VKEGRPEQIIVFASDFGIEILEKAASICVDGTFRSAPAPFCQVFVIMAELGCASGASIPVVFGLLPNKTTATYVKFFEIVAGLSENMFTGTGTSENCFFCCWKN